jgi:hypothetical protein
VLKVVVVGSRQFRSVNFQALQELLHPTREQSLQLWQQASSGVHSRQIPER